MDATPLSKVDPRGLRLYEGRAETAHLVEVYDDDAALARSVGKFLSSISDGDGAIVIATEPHRHAIGSVLAGKVDLPRAVDQGRYVALDAATTLSLFMRDGLPDRRLFEHALRDVIAGMPPGIGIRAFGEMVALLWAEGNVAGALALEDAWNDFIERNPLRLYCAYPANGFGAFNPAPMIAVCERHSHVLVP